MKNFFKRFLVLLVVFILGVAGTAFLMNNETTDDRSDMNDAVLPEVMVQFGDVLTNRMYGYRQPMEADFVRDSVTPLDTTKKLTLVVNHMIRRSGIFPMKSELLTEARLWRTARSKVWIRVLTDT